MRIAYIHGGVVVNLYLFDINPNIENFIASESANIGDYYDYGTGIFSLPDRVDTRTPDEIKRDEINLIDLRLLAIDVESIRPLRAVASGNQMDFDMSKLESLESEADNLRSERANLLG